MEKPAKIPLSATLSTPFSTPGINSFGIAPPLILFSTSLPFLVLMVQLIMLL